METIGDRIRMLRTERKWTRKELAEKMGYGVNVVASWETMRNFPSAMGVISASEVFGVTTDYILKGGKR